MAMATIELKNIQKSFENVEVIKGIDLTIKDKEFMVFVGPSGCGKSTMLRLIAGLEEITSGQVLIDGEDMTAKNATERGLAMVFQSYALYPHKTVRDNMAFPLKAAGVDKPKRYAAVDQAAEVLKLEALLDRRPKDLSGGQRQRVAIGRCLVREPKSFLFDEPLSNLDAALRIQMRVEIARLHNQLQATMIYVTHDQVEAMTLADRIVVFSGGRIEQVGPPLELYRNPNNRFVAQFIGSPKMNVIPCPEPGTAPEAPLPLGRKVRTSRKLKNNNPVHFVGIRPEHITIVPENEATLVGTVGVGEHLGSDTFVYLDVDAATSLIIRLQGDVDVKVGQTLGIYFDPNQVHLFDKDEKTVTTS